MPDSSPMQPSDSGNEWIPVAAEMPPPPTLSPAALSLGATLFVWGLIGPRILIGIGLVVFAIALAAWIKEIRHERERKNP